MDMIEILRSIFALIAVLGMIGLAAFATKRFGLARGVPLRSGRRLSLIETLAIDTKRRAAIIACDGREHLIIIDPAGVSVIERGIPARIDDGAIETEPPPRKLGVPSSVVRLLQRGPRDETIALRAAGAL